MGEGVAAGIRRIVYGIEEAHGRGDVGATRLLLETMAGQGTTIGDRVEHLAEIVGKVRCESAVGVCVDTCHVFAAGYDVRTDEGFGRLVGEMESFGLADRVGCIHVNDSKGDCGSRVDRHEHVGRGKIRRKGFLRVLSYRGWLHVPRILETPKGEDDRGRNRDRMNLRRLRSYVKLVL